MFKTKNILHINKGGFFMTQKELLYLEDAIGHEEVIISVCENEIDNIEDESIKSFVESEIDKHNDIKEELFSLLEEKTDE